MTTSLEPLRPAAVAGTWYPDDPDVLTFEVDRYLGAVEGAADVDVTALIAPHAGLIYSGPVAAHAYHAVLGKAFDVAVLVGPSHSVGFDGVSIYERGAFATPAGARRRRRRPRGPHAVSVIRHQVVPSRPPAGALPGAAASVSAKPVSASGVI